MHHVVKVGLNVTFLPSKALDRIPKCTTKCMCVKVKKLSRKWAKIAMKVVKLLNRLKTILKTGRGRGFTVTHLRHVEKLGKSPTY